MSTTISLGSSVRSEWIKFRSVRSTLWGLITLVILTIGIGVLVSFAVRGHWSHASFRDRITFDPVNTSLSGTLFAQFAVGVIGALFVSNEYANKTIRTSLSAMPRRMTFAFGKITVLVVSLFLITEAVCIIAVLAGQSVLSGVTPTGSLGNASDLRAVLSAGVYLTLLSLLGLALGLILRHTSWAISVFVSLLLILPLLVFLLPSNWQNDVSKYLPANLGQSMTSTTVAAHSFAPWTAMIILVVYVAGLLTAGLMLLVSRDV